MPAPGHGESLREVHETLPPDIRAHLVNKEQATHEAILQNMRSMSVPERIQYGHQIMAPPIGTINRAQAGQLQQVDQPEK